MTQSERRQLTAGIVANALGLVPVFALVSCADPALWVVAIVLLTVVQVGVGMGAGYVFNWLDARPVQPAARAARIADELASAARLLPDACVTCGTTPKGVELRTTGCICPACAPECYAPCEVCGRPNLHLMRATERIERAHRGSDAAP